MKLRKYVKQVEIRQSPTAEATTYTISMDYRKVPMKVLRELAFSYLIVEAQYCLRSNRLSSRIEELTKSKALIIEQNN